MHRALLALLLLLALAAPLQAQPAAERHSEVRLLAPADGDPGSSPGQALAARLAPHGVGLDHGRWEQTEGGPAVRTVLSARELAGARAAGVEVEVLVEDVKAHYLATRGGTCEEGRLAVSRIAADLCGTMGGYPTFDVVLAHLDTLAARYPEVVSARQSLGQSIEGRDLWMVEISDNPGADEGEPEALYTGVHHAREPGSMMAVLYYMYYLGEQYAAGNPDVTALVDGRRLFFVPILNPDGYVYNETTDPEGGGMWRKNRRDNGDGEFGVDLNRNYGFEWGHDDEGSSPFTFSETYRGAAPFSEPETQALRDFVEGRRIAVALNYHTFGDLLLYPWGYTEEQTPDAAAFEALGIALTAHNGYTYGQGPQILYGTNGGSDDWMYGEQTAKPKILSFTPEVGDWFWPDPYDVYPLADENLEANLGLAQSATVLPVANEPEAPAASGLALEVTGPNPLRRHTGIAFTLAAQSAVRLAVYDVLGREVAVLAEGERAAGRHAATFDASGLAPGVYVLRLTAGGEAATKRITVVR